MWHVIYNLIEERDCKLVSKHHLREINSMDIPLKCFEPSYTTYDQTEHYYIHMSAPYIMSSIFANSTCDEATSSAAPKASIVPSEANDLKATLARRSGEGCLPPSLAHLVPELLPLPSPLFG